MLELSAPRVGEVAGIAGVCPVHGAVKPVSRSWTGVKDRNAFLIELHAAQAHPPVENLPGLVVLRVVEVARLGQKVGADGVQYGWLVGQT